MPLFDRNAAVEYAVKYAITPNPDYFPAYSNDCTNFVSQAMLAGGWTMVGGSYGDRKDDDSWWYGESFWTLASYTWAGAHNFSRFVQKSRRAAICDRGDLAPGDVVQIAKDGHVFHSMIVTAIAVDGPQMSYHSRNTLHKALGEIEKSYPSSDNNSFLYWKIARSF
jgi:hypothetical protein